MRAELDEKAGRMAWRRGRADEAVALLTEALAFLERENLKHPVARVSSVLAEIDFREGRASEAVERLERALAELRGVEPDADVAEASAQLGRFLIMSDALDAAVPHLELALVLAQALELREILVHALTSKSVMYIRTNRLEEARILLEGALATARTHDLPSAAIRAINNLSVVFESSDLFTAAADVADQGQELARRIGDKLWEVNFLIGGLSACVMVGRWEEAYPRAAEAEELVPESARLPTMVPLFLNEIDCARGALDAARARLERSAWLQDADTAQIRTMYLLHLAQLLRLEGNTRAALDVLEPVLALTELGITYLTTKLSFVEALEAAFELGDIGRLEELLVTIESLRPGERPPLLDAHARRFRAKLSGDEAGFTAAASRFRDLEMPFWLAMTELEHAELLSEQGRGSEAEPLLADAREIFERLEARPWLERAAALGPEQPAEVSV